MQMHHYSKTKLLKTNHILTLGKPIELNRLIKFDLTAMHVITKLIKENRLTYNSLRF